MTAGKYLTIKYRQSLSLQKTRSPRAGRDHHPLPGQPESSSSAFDPGWSLVVSPGRVLAHGGGLLALSFCTPQKELES